MQKPHRVIRQSFIINHTKWTANHWLLPGMIIFIVLPGMIIFIGWFDPKKIPEKPEHSLKY
jgi:hypothetical protein